MLSDIELEDPQPNGMSTSLSHVSLSRPICSPVLPDFADMLETTQRYSSRLSLLDCESIIAISAEVELILDEEKLSHRSNDSSRRDPICISFDTGT